MQPSAPNEITLLLLRELRYFGGLSLEETAAALDISIATITHEMRLARAWLRREMES